MNDKLYRLAVTFTNNTTATYLVTGISLTALLRGITFPPGQAKTVPPGTTTVVFEFTSTNNASVLELTLVYTLTSSGVVSPDQTLTGTVVFPHCDACPTQSD